MTSAKLTPNEPPPLPELIKRCAALCTDAERSLKKLSPEKQAFLANNLEAALQQTEFLLRVISDTQDANREAERQGLLRRLFARTDEAGRSGDDVELPKFDVSSQGLHGNSWTVAIPELLSFLAFTHKTGMLWVDTPSENFLIGISGGRLLHASSDQTPEGLRLGEVLVGLGFLTRRQLERFLTKGDDEASISGETLLESGVISDEELHMALCHQVTKLFARLVKSKDAIFRFREGLNVQVAFQVDLDVNQLLLDTARVRDEDVNPVQIAQSVMKEWNSWREELDTKIGADVIDLLGGEVATPPALQAPSGEAPKPKSKGKAKDEPAAPPANGKADANAEAKDQKPVTK